MQTAECLSELSCLGSLPATHLYVNYYNAVNQTNSMFSSDIIYCILREISWKQNYVTVKMIPTWSCCSRLGRLCALTSGSCSHRSGASSWTFNTKTQSQLKQTENKFVEDLCDLYWVSRLRPLKKKKTFVISSLLHFRFIINVTTYIPQFSVL